MSELIINDQNYHQHISPIVDGEKKAMGLIPRDYSVFPKCYSGYSVGMEAVPDMPKIPRNEWAERIRELQENKAALSHIRRTANNGRPIPSLDQNSKGYCWAHSAVMALILTLVKQGQPYTRLSAYFVACIIKNFRDEGGWGAAALDFLFQHGCCTVDKWPEKSMSRSNDNAQSRAEALLYRPTEAWVDLTPPTYNRNLSEDEAGTSLLTLCAVIGDFNWWGHSVCLMDLVLSSQAKANRNGLMATDFDSLDLNDPRDLAIYEATFAKKGINSWTDSYGDLGEFVLEGSRATLNGGAAIRTATVIGKAA